MLTVDLLHILSNNYIWDNSYFYSKTIYKCVYKRMYTYLYMVDIF